MSPDTLTLVVVFASVVVITGAIAMLVMSRTTAAERRLSEMVHPKSSVLVTPSGQLTDTTKSALGGLADALPTSRGSSKRLRRDLALAGFYGPNAAAVFSISELICPLIFAAPPLLLMTGPGRWITAAIGALLGYMVPGLLLARRTARRKREIQNGLADALDLLVLCLEAGSSLDQAIVKASDELGVAYPALGDQLRILITEMRAGKARLDAFRGLAQRTMVDDVRTLVSMLVQTDKFGTSIGQALRTHAEVCRTKRRQRAEEKAQKVGVKLVFPLVFCLFPALYVVMLGPAVLKFAQTFGEMGR